MFGKRANYGFYSHNITRLFSESLPRAMACSFSNRSARECCTSTARFHDLLMMEILFRSLDGVVELRPGQIKSFYDKYLHHCLILLFPQNHESYPAGNIL